MKILIIILAVFMVGCGSDTVSAPNGRGGEGIPCSAFADVRKIVEPNTTQYIIYNNVCNTLDYATTDVNGFMIEAYKVVDTVAQQDDVVKISYSLSGFTYTDHTVGRWQSPRSAQAIIYDYVNGDDFITTTSLPSYIVVYIYEDNKEFDRIINQAGYDSVFAEFNEVVVDL